MHDDAAGVENDEAGKVNSSRDEDGHHVESNTFAEEVENLSPVGGFARK